MVAFAAVALTGCGVAALSEYEGVNILESRGLTLADATDGYLRGETAAHTYVNVQELTEAEYGTNSEGLPAGTTVYRLEIPNLLPDGDFESGTIGDWVLSAAPPAGFSVESAGVLPDGNYLSFEVAPGTYGRFNLNDDLGGGLLDGLVANATYFIQFVAMRDSETTSLIFDYGDAADTSHLTLFQADLSWDFQQDPEVSGTPIESFPGVGVFARPYSFVSSDEDDDYLYVGSPRSGVSLSGGYVDNIRIGRVDNFPHAAFALAAASNTGLAIVPGEYDLSVYVKAEIDSQVTPAAAGANRYRATQISLGGNDNFDTFEAADVGWTDTRWQLVTARFHVTANDLLGDPSLRVQLAPGSRGSPEVGSLLVSEPTLTLVLERN